jgi:multiple sugar transport system permease protein
MRTEAPAGAADTPARAGHRPGRLTRLARSRTLQGFAFTAPLLLLFAGFVIYPMVTFASPYARWVLSDYARSLPPEIEEAGAIDGAGTVATFLHLYLPLIRPPLVAIGTYAFLYAWNEYLYALLLLMGEPRIPLPVAMGNVLTTDNAPWNLLMTVSTIYSIPPVVLYYCFKRYLVSGLVSGAVSGT